MNNILKFLLLISFSAFSQQKEVEILNLKSGINTNIYAKNNTKVRQQVTIQLKTKGFQKHDKEIIKNVAAKDSLLMITLMPISDKTNTDMQIAYGYDKNPSKKEQEDKIKKLQTKFYKKGDNLNKGIVVFHKNNCPRCIKTTNYLLDNNIDFKWVQIPSNEQIVSNTAPKELLDNQSILQEKLKEKKISGSFTTPIFMVNGKITHSHRDLDKFLAKLN